MKKRFKRMYIEITNQCNLNCHFCPKTKRKKEFMSVENFEKTLKKVDGYTDYIYLHVMGEPLLHPKLEEILSIATSYDKKINITTNGTLLEQNLNILKNCKNLRKISLSLHSYESNNQGGLEEYLEKCLNACKILSLNTICDLRLWNLDGNELDIPTKNNLNDRILDYIKKAYNISQLNIVNNTVKLEENTYIGFAEKFDWPDTTNSHANANGYCHAIIEQLAILVDGTVTPCCLDNEGIINLGNIYSNDLETILDTKRVKDMVKGFQNRTHVEELCKHCQFSQKF
ncbi:MAG: radical SAM protein [Clostridia bacterium]